MDNLTPSQRRKNMQHIHSKDTGIEVALRKELWKSGIHYRKNYGKLPGKPDIAITKHKIAVFCDSEFFHGKDWEVRRPKVLEGNNPDYWITKIERNMQRDHEVDLQLSYLGWTVIRFWGKEILADPAECIKVINEVILDEKLQQFDSDYISDDMDYYE